MPIREEVVSVFLVVGLSILGFVSLPSSTLAEHFVHPTKGYTLDYPDKWNVDWKLIGFNGPLVLTTFPAGGYHHSGLLPAGGIEINIQVFRVSAVDENKLLLVGGPETATNVTRSVQVINHRDVSRADYDLHFTDSVTYPATELVVHVNEKVFKILIMYERSPLDPKDRAIGEAALVEIVASVSTGTAK